MDDTAILPARRKLDVDTFYRMAEVGVLGWNDRVELIDGGLIDMAPIGTDHGATVNGLTRALVLACEGKAIVAVQNTVRLDRFNEPQPDFGVYRLRSDKYRSGHPGPADTLLLVEVSSNSIHYDRTVKLPLYAKTGIAEYWIVDLARRMVDVHRDPDGGAYASLRSCGPTDTVMLSAAPDVGIALGLVFGGAQ